MAFKCPAGDCGFALPSTGPDHGTPVNDRVLAATADRLRAVARDAGAAAPVGGHASAVSCACTAKSRAR